MLHPSVEETLNVISIIVVTILGRSRQDDLFLIRQRGGWCRKAEREEGDIAGACFDRVFNRITGTEHTRGTSVWCQLIGKMSIHVRKGPYFLDHLLLNSRKKLSYGAQCPGTEMMDAVGVTETFISVVLAHAKRKNLCHVISGLPPIIRGEHKTLRPSLGQRAMT